MNEFLSEIRALVTSRTVKATSIVLGGNGVSSILAVVFVILAARFLGPAGWGIVAAVASFAEIIFAFSELGLGAGLLRFGAKGLSQMQRTLFTLRAISAILGVLLLLVLAPWIAIFVFKSADSILAAFAALALLGALLLDFQIVATEAKQNWKLAAFFISLTNSLRLLLLLFAIFTSRVSLVSVLFIFTGSPLVAWFVSLLFQRFKFGLGKTWQKTFKTVAAFSGWMGGNRIASSINARLDVLLLLQLMGPQAAGVYAAVGRLAMGVPIVIASFAYVLAPNFASLKRENLRPYFKKAVGIASIIASGLVFGILVSPLVVSFFGPAYRESLVVLQILLAGLIPYALATPAVNVLIYAFGKPKIIALLSILQLPAIIFLNLYLIPRIGILGPALTLAGVNLSTMMVTYFFAWRSFSRK